MNSLETAIQQAQAFEPLLREIAGVPCVKCGDTGLVPSGEPDGVKRYCENGCWNNRQRAFERKMRGVL